MTAGATRKLGALAMCKKHEACRHHSVDDSGGFNELCYVKHIADIVT